MSDLSSPVTGCHLESDPGVSPGTKKKRGKGALSLLLSLGKQRKKAPAGTLGLLVLNNTVINWDVSNDQHISYRR